MGSIVTHVVTYKLTHLKQNMEHPEASLCSRDYFLHADRKCGHFNFHDIYLDSRSIYFHFHKRKQMSHLLSVGSHVFKFVIMTPKVLKALKTITMFLLTLESSENTIFTVKE